MSISEYVKEIDEAYSTIRECGWTGSSMNVRDVMEMAVELKKAELIGKSEVVRNEN